MFIVAILLGTPLFVLLAAGLVLPEGYEIFGTGIYEQYMLSLLDGRMDVPARVVGLEGHYDASGRAFVYHGLAPLLPRLLLAPFIDLSRVELSWLTVALWAAGGTLAYHVTFDRLLLWSRNRTETGERPRPLRGERVLLALAVWGTTPGLILASNRSFYHEPVAVAYCCTGWFLYLVSRIMTRERTVPQSLVPLSILSAVTVFARPHMAAVLYASVLALMGVHLHGRARRHDLRTLVAPLVVLGLAGSGLLAWNAVRFGHPLRVHGTFHASELEHGLTYWDLDGIEHPVVEAHNDYGTFNLRRVPANAVRYAADLPRGLVPAAPVARLAESVSGAMPPVRTEWPQVGFLYLWPHWLLIVFMGLCARTGPRLRPEAAWILVFVGAASTLWVLSYAMMAERYLAEIWPLVAGAVMLTISRSPLAAGRDASGAAVGRRSFAVLVAVAGSASLVTAVLCAFSLVEGGTYRAWSEEQCREIVAAKGTFTSEEITRICEPPY